MQTLCSTGFRPKRRLVFITAGLALAAILTFYELSASRWVWLAKELANSPPTFYLPLDTQSKGLQTGFETDPIGQTILWGDGPNSRLRFSTYAPMSLRLCYAFSSPIQGQEVDVSLNGKHVAAYADASRLRLPIDAGHPACHDFVSKPGENTLRFDYRTWNHGGTDFAPDEPRKLAVSFTMLQILPNLTAAP